MADWKSRIREVAAEGMGPLGGLLGTADADDPKRALAALLKGGNNAFTGKAREKLLASLRPGEPLRSAASGEIPRTGLQYLTKNAEFAVIAVTDSRCLVASGRRIEEIDISDVYDVGTDGGRLGASMTIHRRAGEPLSLRGLTPPGRAQEITDLLRSPDGGSPIERPEPKAAEGRAEDRITAEVDIPPLPTIDLEATAHLGEEGRAALEAALRQRTDARRAHLEALRGHRATLEANRRDRLLKLRDEMGSTLRGRELASIGGVLDPVRLFPTELVHRGERHPLEPGVKARVEQSGNVSSSQGWTMKTQHDSRELHVIVEGPGWYVSVRTAKGGAVATDAGAMISNWDFRQRSRAAHEFVSAVMNAAARAPQFRRDAERRLNHQQQEARRLLEETSEIEAAIAAQERFAADHRAEAVTELAIARELAEGRGRSLRLPGRSTVKLLERELALYEVEPFDPVAGVPTVRELQLDRPAEPPPETAGAAASSGDVSRHMQQLIDLRDAGVLTDEEFATKVTALHRTGGS